MPEVTSTTIVKNGMPFIGNVLEQVAPYMKKMIITLSKKADYGTKAEIKKFMNKHFHITLLEENISTSSELTSVRNEQLKYVDSEWILFLDDDDYWPRDQLELCLKELDKDEEIQAYSVTPFQLVNFNQYDVSWEKRSFSKFLRRDGLRFIKPWPKDLPCGKEGHVLHWKKHPDIVKKLPYRFFHLSYLKDWHFRKQKGFEKYIESKGEIAELNKPFEL